MTNYQLTKSQRKQLVDYREHKRLTKLMMMRNPTIGQAMQAGYTYNQLVKKKHGKMYDFIIVLILLLICSIITLAIIEIVNQGTVSGLISKFSSTSNSQYSNQPLPQTSASGTEPQEGITTSSSTAPTNKRLSNAVYRSLLKFFNVANIEMIKKTDLVTKDVADYLSKILSFSDSSDNKVIVKLSLNKDETKIETMQNVATVIYGVTVTDNSELSGVIVTTSDDAITAHSIS